MLFQNKLLKKGKKYPLDYIVEIPDLLKDGRISNKLYKNMFYRRNILKNIVFRRIIEIREIKKKPKLS